MYAYYVMYFNESMPVSVLPSLLTISVVILESKFPPPYKHYKQNKVRLTFVCLFMPIINTSPFRDVQLQWCSRCVFSWWLVLH